MKLAIPLLLAALCAPAVAQPFHIPGLLDDLESYDLGPLAGQGLWFSAGTVSFVDATVFDPAFGDRTLSVGVSPSSDRAVKLLNVPPAYGRLDFDVRLGDVGQGTAELIEGASNNVVAFLAFQPGHFIRTRNRGSSSTFDTGAKYVPNATNRIGMEVIPGGVVNYYLNGELFYVGEDLNDFKANPSIGYNEFEFTNEQFVSGAIYIDNLEIVASGPTPCNDSDLAEPFGDLDFSDVVAFLTALGSMDPIADLAEPFGVWDFSDVVAFLSAFGAGCP